MAFILGNLEFMVALLGLRQASAPARLRHPPLSDDAVLPVPGADLNTGNTHGIARAPTPLGQGRRKGGARRITLSGHFPVQHQSDPKFFRQFSFPSGKILTYKLSSGIFLDFLDFKPEKVRPKKFQSKIFYDFQLSRQNFSGKRNFAARKSTGFRIPWPAFRRTVYEGESS